MTTTTLMTAEELLHLPNDAHRRELVAGELRVMSPDYLDRGLAAVELSAALSTFVRHAKLGLVVLNVGFVLERNPDTVFGPDVAFIRRERAPTGEARKRYVEHAPDLAVEILAPSYTACHLIAKIRLYFQAGARQVWVVDPEAWSVTIHTPDRIARTLVEGETVDGGDVVPGFSISVSEVFA